MMKIKIFLAAFLLGFSGPALAQIVPSLPYALSNDTIADADQVMANFNAIVAGTNTNAANAGANTNITALNGLTTPLAPASGGSSVYTGGVSGGSANAQTVTSPTPAGYVAAAGRRVTFIAGFTNNAATTLNVNGTGAINVYRQTTAGIVPLAGGEIVAGQATDVWYDGTQYELLNGSPQALVPACNISDFAGVNLPSGYLFADGAAKSRATYAGLMSCLTLSTSATTASASASVAVPDSTSYQVGWYVGGANVTCNSTILSKADSTHITISANAGATGGTTLTVGPYPQGDCSTTFNLPNFVGRAAAGVDGSTNITSATCANAGSLGATCGAQTVTLATANLPAYTPSGSIANGAITINVNGPYTQGIKLGSGIPVPGSGSLDQGALNITASQAGSSFTGTAQGGTSAAFTNLPPVGLVYKIIKY